MAFKYAVKTLKIAWRLLLAIIAFVIIYFFMNPMVLDYSDYRCPSQNDFSKGDIIQPFADLDFTSGKYTAYFINNEQYAWQEHYRGKVFKTEDIQVLNKLQNIRFEYTGSDAATIENKFYLLKDGEVVFSTAVAWDASGLNGFQNQCFGWIEPANGYELTDFKEHFNRVYWPLIALK